MVYLLNTELKENVLIHLSLQKVFGLGKSQSILICKKLGFGLNYKIMEMKMGQLNRLKELLEKTNMILANDLIKSQSLSLKILTSIKSYKGLRRISGLPIRGQRTHTNAKTTKRFKKRVKK